jgi:YegS/Rv2252/BmrU family lipid kinase
MKVLAIINPVAGASRRHAQIRQTLACIHDAGFEVLSRVPGSAEASQELARSAGREADAGGDYRAVIAMGGDGTIREVAQGLVGSSLPLVVWPTGTENLIAKSFGFKANPAATLACVRDGQQLQVDVGRVDGHCFLVVAGVGFDAEVVQRLASQREGHITHLTYSAHIWRTFWEHKFPRLRVFADGREVWQEQGLAFIGNMPRYSLGLRVIRDAVHDDGLLDLCLLRCRHQVDLIGHSLRTLVGKHIEHPAVTYVRASEIRIESDQAVPFQLDGEAAGMLPLDVSVRPKAIRLLVPPTFKNV